MCLYDDFDAAGYVHVVAAGAVLIRIRSHSHACCASAITSRHAATSLSVWGASPVPAVLRASASAMRARQYAAYSGSALTRM